MSITVKHEFVPESARMTFSELPFGFFRAAWVDPLKGPPFAPRLFMKDLGAGNDIFVCLEGQAGQFNHRRDGWFFDVESDLEIIVRPRR